MTLTRPAAIAASALALVGLLAVASGALAAGTPQAVSIIDKTFSPKDLTINAGDTVTWTVTKSIGEPHTVTSGTSGGADIGKVFDSGLTLKDNGQTYSFTFAAAGTYPYFCQVHPAEMTGTITVVGAGGSAPPAASQAPASEPPASAAPASAAPGTSASPGASESPAPSEIPGAGPEHPPISTTDKLTAAGVLGATLVLLFGAAWYYRRVNR